MNVILPTKWLKSISSPGKQMNKKQTIQIKAHT